MSDGAVDRKLRILGIYTHPHDFIHAAGTCGNHIADGDAVTIATMTDGRNTHNERLGAELRKPPGERDERIMNESPEAYSARKANELKKAAGYFGISDVRILRYRDRPLKHTDEVLSRIVTLLCDVRPDILITECPAHISATRSTGATNDHYVTSAIVRKALTIAAFPTTGADRVPHRVAQVYYLGVDLAYREVDFFVDISDQYESRLKAEMCFGSQAQTAGYALKRVEILPGYFGWMAGVSYAEPFVRGSVKLDRRLSATPLELELAEESSLNRIERQELKQEQGQEFSEGDGEASG